MRTAPVRTLAVAVGLGLVAVLAAAMAGPAHFGGPRALLHAGQPRLRPHPAAGQLLGRRPAGSALPGWLVWVALAVAVVALVAGLIWLLRRRRRIGLWSPRRPAAPASAPVVVTTVAGPEPEASEPVVRSGIELALESLTQEREPRDAVVRAWLGVQAAAQESGVPRGAAETPTEFTSRIVRRIVVDDRPVRQLLGLYLRTRFGDHPVSDADVGAARDALREMVATWPARC